MVVWGFDFLLTCSAVVTIGKVGRGSDQCWAQTLQQLAACIRQATAGEVAGGAADMGGDSCQQFQTPWCFNQYRNSFCYPSSQSDFL